MSKSNDYFYCDCCEDRLPNFTDSFFNFSRNPELSTPVGSECGSIEVNMSDVKNEDVEPNIFDELKDVRIKHPHKFQSIKELLNENLVDMIIVGETKLDETFRNGLV
jgi:hypothetical protein